MAKGTKRNQPKAIAQTQILATLQNLMGGQDAVKVASAKILEALGESPANLLRMKAAQYTEMAELLDACNDGMPPKSEADADAEGNASEAESDAAAEDDGDEEDEKDEKDDGKPK